MNRRDHGDGSIHFDHRGTECRDERFHRNCAGRWVGVASLGQAGGKR